MRADEIPMSDPKKKRIKLVSNIIINEIKFKNNETKRIMKSILKEYTLFANRAINRNKYIPVHLAHEITCESIIRNERSGF